MSILSDSLNSLPFGFCKRTFVLSATFYFSRRDWRGGVTADLSVFSAVDLGAGSVLQEGMGGRDLRRLCVQLMLLPEASALPTPLASKSE